MNVQGLDVKSFTINKLFNFPQLTSANIVIFPACNELFILCLFGHEISFSFFCMLRIDGGLCIKQATSHRAPIIDVNPLKLKQHICTCFTNRRKMCHCKILGQYMNAWPSLVHISFDVSKAGPRSVFLKRSHFVKPVESWESARLHTNQSPHRWFHWLAVPLWFKVLIREIRSWTLSPWQLLLPGLAVFHTGPQLAVLIKNTLSFHL